MYVFVKVVNVRNSKKGWEYKNHATKKKIKNKRKRENYIP